MKIARGELKITQEELAARLQTGGVNIERDSVSRIEIGTRFVADLELLILAEVLKKTPLYLLGVENYTLLYVKGPRRITPRPIFYSITSICAGHSPVGSVTFLFSDLYFLPENISVNSPSRLRFTVVYSSFVLYTPTNALLA